MDKEISRTFDIVDKIKNQYNKDDILAAKINGVWEKYSNIKYSQLVDLFSYGLLEIGFKKCDKIVTISNNRPEWNIVDMAMSQIGIIHVPVYPTISFEEHEYILNHCEANAIIISDKLLLDKLLPIINKVKSIKNIFTFNEIDGMKNCNDIINIGKENQDKFNSTLSKIKNSILPNELVTIIYTSGTTGYPKGVMLSHNNLVSNIIETAKCHTYDEKARVLSFLPLCHVYERMINYMFQYKGISIYYAENMGTIIENIKEIQPNLINSVPRLLERIYETIISKGRALKGIKKVIFFWAIRLGLKFDLNVKFSWWYKFRLHIANKLVFHKWREALGDNLRLVVSGGAALQPRLGRVFHAAGIAVLEGYGLTETSPVIAVNNFTTKECMIGTVGPILNNVEVKIDKDGEILCKGPNIMLGYYKEPELTKEVIDDDGWFHTGDIGTFINNKFLKITDRKKEIFKLSSGKYIAPQVLENKLKESMFIDQLMIIGENEKFASALISPNLSLLHDWGVKNGIHFRDNRELLKKTETLNLFQKEINRFNKDFGLTEQVKRFRLVLKEWNPKNGMLSPTLKLKRKTILEYYQKEIEGIYATNKNNEIKDKK